MSGICYHSITDLYVCDSILHFFKTTKLIFVTGSGQAVIIKRHQTDRSPHSDRVYQAIEKTEICLEVANRIYLLNGSKGPDRLG